MLKMNTFQVDSNWYEGERNAMLGIFPTTYVEIIPQDAVASQVPQRMFLSNICGPQVSTLSKKERNMDGAAKAKFNFTAQTPMEVSFLKGTNILMSLKSKIFYTAIALHR